MEEAVETGRQRGNGEAVSHRGAGGDSGTPNPSRAMLLPRTHSPVPVLGSFKAVLKPAQRSQPAPSSSTARASPQPSPRDGEDLSRAPSPSGMETPVGHTAVC